MLGACYPDVEGDYYQIGILVNNKPQLNLS